MKTPNLLLIRYPLDTVSITVGTIQQDDRPNLLIMRNPSHY